MLLDKCCFTLELRLGTLIIAGVSALIGLLTSGLLLSDLRIIKYFPIDMVIIKYLLIIAELALAVCSFLLLYGAFKEIAWMCIPFMVSAIVYTILAFTDTIRFSLVQMNILTMCTAILNIVVVAYFIFVIYSFYKSIS